MNIYDHHGIQSLLKVLGLVLDDEKFVSSYNVAPTTAIHTVALGQTSDSKPILAPMHWGIVPNWAKLGQFHNSLISARAETIFEKASFRHLVRRSRAIVPVNGFYEWRRKDREKLPYYIDRSDGQAMAIAAIHQESNDGVRQVCVVTTQANKQMKNIHTRMPCILESDEMSDWLYSDDKAVLLQFLDAKECELLKMTPVSKFVNSVRNNGVKCMQRLEEGAQ